MFHYKEKIEAEGQLLVDYFAENNRKTNVNYSSIVSELIQAAGTLCEYFASDIVYDIKDLENYIENTREEVVFIGIRDSGVDSTIAIKQKLKNSATYGTNNYIRLYRLETSIPNDHTYKIELRRVDEYDTKKELLGGK